MTSLLYWSRGYRGRFALGALMLLATNVLGFLVPKLIKTAIDSLQAGVDIALLERTAAIVFGVATLQACVRIASRLLIFNAARDIEGDMRQKLFAHVLSWSPDRLRAHPLGDLQSRMLNDLTNVRLLFGVGLLNLVNTSFAYLVALPLMWSESPRLVLISLLPYPLMMGLMVLMGRRVFRFGLGAGERLGDLSNLINEDLGARMYIAASGLQATQSRRFAACNDAYLGANIGLVRTRAMMFPIMSMLGSLGVALALLYGGGLVLEGAMSLGSLVAFTSYLVMLSFPTMMLGFMLALFQRGRASWQRVAELFEEAAWRGGDQPLTSDRPDVVLDHLIVVRGEKRVIDDVSLDVRFGERLGIVGEVGSGKSTLLAVLARQLETDPERYLLGGTCVNKLQLSAVRTAIGVVPQQPFLFSMSVRENVALGAPEASASQLENALDIAAVRGEMSHLPQGLATEIGERGVTLSGGQKQRLALARALVPDPHVLLLDDCFSAVDAETEKRIIERLLDTEKQRTFIIATHRLAVLDRVDRVIVLQDGKIVESGAPSELLAREGSRYRSLYERQRLAEAVGEAA